MTRHGAAIEALKRTGHRLTPQRVMVLSVIAEQPAHVGVEEIQSRVKAVYPYMDQATVYRTIHLLKELGLVTEIQAGGASRYELSASGRHHHMVCRECGGAFDLSPSYLEEFRATLVRDFGFEPDLDHFAVAGRCASCGGKRVSPAAAISTERK
ncbi:MAG: transcriptional repressor [Chloroflexi bacterium]|nr:transcriptional repressor [Chloroflexota bacterium]